MRRPTTSDAPPARRCGMSGAALVGGYAADAVFGDPRRFHPVAGFGKVALAAERVGYAPSRTRGALFASALVASAALAAELRRPCRPAHCDWDAPASWPWSPGRRSAGGRWRARRAGSPCAWRPATSTGHARCCPPCAAETPPASMRQGLSRAAVESVAENTADAVVGALVWGAVAGPAGVAAYRAANTLDAMVGHRSERYASFGWAAARLDDVLSWPGARLGALLAALFAPLVGGSRRADAARREA